jgi:hypothetical protein
LGERAWSALTQRREIDLSLSKRFTLSKTFTFLVRHPHCESDKKTPSPFEQGGGSALSGKLALRFVVVTHKSSLGSERSGDAAPERLLALERASAQRLDD